MNDWKEIAQKMGKAILAKIQELSDQGMKQEEIAKMLGLGRSRSLISEWLGGHRQAQQTKFHLMMQYMEALGIDYRDFFPKRTEQQLLYDDQVKLDVYCLAGAGGGIDLQESEPLETIYAPRKWVAQCDYAVRIAGDSMRPTIPDMSICGIKKDMPFVPNLIYIAYIPYEGHVVKRVRVDLQKRELIFHSDNPDQTRFPEFSLSEDEATKIILGKVIWTIKREV